MEFLGIGYQELLLVLVLALVFVGPERLPGVAYQIGKAVRTMQQYARQVRDEFSEEIGFLEEQTRIVRGEVNSVAAELREQSGRFNEELREATAPISQELGRASDPIALTPGAAPMSQTATGSAPLATGVVALADHREPSSEGQSPSSASALPPPPPPLVF